MTDTADTPDIEVLPKFEGQDVIASRVRITGAGEGLSDALDLEPEAFHHSDTRFFLLETKITQVNHPTDKKSGKLVRVHTASTQNVAEVDPELARKLLAESDERKRTLRREAAEAQGIHEIPFVGDGEDDDPTDEVEDGAPAQVDPEADAPPTSNIATFSGNGQGWEYPDADPRPTDPDQPTAEDARKSRRGRRGQEDTSGS